MRMIVTPVWSAPRILCSVVGAMGNPGQANYCASKAGLSCLTKSLARTAMRWLTRQGGKLMSYTNYVGLYSGVLEESLYGREVDFDDPGILVNGVDINDHSAYTVGRAAYLGDIHDDDCRFVEEGEVCGLACRVAQ